MVQWLGLHASAPRGMGLIPDLGTKILHAVWPKILLLILFKGREGRRKEGGIEGGTKERRKEGRKRQEKERKASNPGLLGQVT